MLVLLWAFTGFNLVFAVLSLGQAARLVTREERAHWRSKTLLTLAAILAWTFPIAALAGVALGWSHYSAGKLDAVQIVLAPLGWLMAMGIVFALVDFLEDGVLGNARARTPDAGA
jgi:hypothetical protein